MCVFLDSLSSIVVGYFVGELVAELHISGNVRVYERVQKPYLGVVSLSQGKGYFECIDRIIAEINRYKYTMRFFVER